MCGWKAWKYFKFVCIIILSKEFVIEINFEEKIIIEKWGSNKGEIYDWKLIKFLDFMKYMIEIYC